MKRSFTLIILLALGTIVFAQSECDGTRYVDYSAFSNVDVTSGVVFGNNISVGNPVLGTPGNPVDLKMDVYEPAGDTENSRPVVVIGFGGSFISGSRGDVEFLCRIFAKLGYVAVAPDYRVGFFALPADINQVTTTLAVMRAAHDMKACVRYLKKTVAEDGNPYGIDPDRIILSGISAGAIGAIHAGYLDDDTEIPSYLENDTAGLGGVAGNSGTPDYDSDPLAVMSFSGTIGDSSWIKPGDVPICSIHEENDDVVPYNTTEVSVSGVTTGLIASGSGDLHIRAENVGIDNCLLTYRGVQNHVGYFVDNIDQQALDFARDFAKNMVCDGGSDCSSVDAMTSSIANIEQNSIDVYPNPANDVLKFRTNEVGTVELIDATGRTVLSTTTKLGQNQLDVSDFPKGAYVMMFRGTTIGTARFIKE